MGTHTPACHCAAPSSGQRFGRPTWLAEVPGGGSAGRIGRPTPPPSRTAAKGSASSFRPAPRACHFSWPNRPAETAGDGVGRLVWPTETAVGRFTLDDKLPTSAHCVACSTQGEGGRECLALHTQGGPHTRRFVATVGVLLFKGGAGVGPRVERSELQRRFGCPYTRQCIHKAVHTQGGAHTRWSVATARVLLLKGGAGVGRPHTRRCIHKAVHTQGGLWPPQESCYLRGVRGLACVERSVPKKVWGGGVRKGRGGGNFVHTPHRWVFLLQEARGVGGVSERAGTSAGRNTAAWQFGRIFGQNNWRQSRRSEPAGRDRRWPLHFRPSRHRRRASPPFHSDELAPGPWAPSREPFGCLKGVGWALVGPLRQKGSTHYERVPFRPDTHLPRICGGRQHFVGCRIEEHIASRAQMLPC